MMRARHQPPRAVQSSHVESGITRLLLLADGTIMAHNLTPELAEVLRLVAPDDAALVRRAESRTVAGYGAGKQSNQGVNELPN